MDEVSSSFANSSETKSRIITFKVLLVTTISILLIWFVQCLWKTRRHYMFARKIKGPPSLPIIGSAWHFIGDCHDIFHNLVVLCDTYQGVGKVWFGLKLIYSVSEPKHYEILLTKCLEKKSFYSKINAIIPGIFTAEFPEWQVHRKMINPTFNQKYLNSFVEVFSEKSEILINILEKYSGKGEFDLLNLMSRCTLDIICETVMGTNIEAQTNDTNMCRWVDRMMEIAFLKTILPWYHIDLIFYLSPLGREVRQIIKNVEEFNGQVIKKKKKEREEAIANSKDGIFEEPHERRTFLDYLLEVTDDENKAFTEKELQKEVFLFIIAGFDTTGSTNSFVLTMLGLHQDLQDKVYDEIMEVIGPDRQPEVTDLPQLKYLDRFIKETLRLFPVAGFLVRTATEDVDIGDCIIPAEATIAFGIFSLHRNEKYWPDPLKFDPDRFLPEEMAKRHPCTYVPFSYGPRNCIGMRYSMMALKTVVASIVRKYRIFTSYKNIQDIKLKSHLLLRPKDGYKVYIQARNNN